MHDKVIVFVCVDSNGKTRGEIEEEAADLAAENLDVYMNYYYDSFDMDKDWLDTYITFDGGKVGKCCRLSEFEHFTESDDLPLYLLNGAIFDQFLMKKYGVPWHKVVERELEEAKVNDSDDYQWWMVSADVHI